MNRFLRRCNQSLWFIMLLAASPTLMAESDADALTALLADIHTLESDVRQVIVESNGDVLEESRIRFVLQRPDGFYWETLEPWPELIVTDGDTLWHYQPDLWQLTINDWQADESELAAQLLSGELERLTDDYAVDRHEASTERQQSFVLTPMDPGSMYERLELYFEDRVLASIDVFQSNGQRTLWEFNNVMINTGVDEALFQFELPDDADEDMMDILDNRASARER
ncbi:MAG: outer membrane lipoprotein chaperone LolA [Pseudomonadota bacterium]